MTRNHEIRPDLDEGIDRKVLSQLRARFLKLNEGRMARAMEGLSTRQQGVLSLLPLFFHVNHPLLPGYVSGSTPAGLSNYEPDADTLAEAQRLTRSFSYKPRHGSNPPRPIHGLFLMGSLGTLAQADQSDMDVWVCHGPDLSESELAELRKKCQLLETWAASQGAEAHFFLIDPARFVRGERDTQLSSEDCGTTQHYLLLDEFYRTAIWLAGRTPIWWLVPVYEESSYDRYTHTLLSKRFIRADETLDLGHLAFIPPGEYIGAGLWQLFKGIESPYKSVLKLLLTEVYASEHPRVHCLSLRFKQAVFANQLDLDELDPYVVVYRRIEEYLIARNETERLELVRRALYLKVNRKLTGSNSRNPSWQRALLERLAQEWHWDQRQLALLDSRSQWKVRQVGAERRALVNELNYSYRFLTQFARNEQTASRINKRDLSVLGRRLYAAFERKAGKVEFINPGIAPDLAEDTLTLVHAPDRKEPGQYQWGLYNGSLTALEWEHFAPIKRSRHLLELLTWCHRNGVIDSSTRLALHPGSSDLSEFELFNLLGSLQQTIALPLPTVAEEPLLRAAVPSEVLILVNVGIDPLKHHRDLNILMTTERTDSLSYAGVRENLVLTLDQVTLNSWNEVLVKRFDGPHALLDCISDYLNNLPDGPQQPKLRVRCFCHNRAQFIAQRVEDIIETAHDLLLSRLNHRYLIQVEQRYHVLELNPGQVRHIALESLPALIDYLAVERTSYSPLHLDPKALEDHDLALLLPTGQPECVQVFYRVYEDQADLYVLDELNTLWQQRLPWHDEQSLLVPLQRFLQSIQYRRDALLPMETSQPLNLDTLYCQLLPSGPGRARRIEARPVPQTPVNKPFYDVQAIVGKSAPGQVQVTLYCNQREFSALEHGDQLFSVVAREIVGQRRETERYRCYITDLDLSGLLGDGPGSTHLYLHYKADLERALNEALDQV
ncbi:class I adenylate cyclase [Pseudomonas vancouverensis]|uniref:Class I adenylate cyclase n=1 Tax=Pseudomonas vancouverensis TaxID=95300 RepID=A0A1H2PGH0_PSEVA|nr:class I adenylate cyclase [Pseudomonas vancouverensis]KAB0497736.1 class I adenylate cyclase [Pseudomonas vancouverensis]TDB66463.1 class I adenylate cyclase [Pseudomonas vancouverensis]SDV16096.1 adenylate cyclase [Pseudomonas vancouverensis]